MSAFLNLKIDLVYCLNYTYIFNTYKYNFKISANVFLHILQEKQEKAS